MSNKLPAWQVYASQLSKVDRGQAMWFPEHPQPVGITIGDVGYIQQGTCYMLRIYAVISITWSSVDSGLFCRLFNITKPREDDLNMGSLKPPEDFKRLNYNAILKAETKNYIQAGTIASKSVKKLEVSPHAGGGT